jgi:hypothetical protein
MSKNIIEKICGRFYKPSIVIHDDFIGELERKLATAIQDRDKARWEVCGFHHLTGFLAGDYALSRGWGYLNDENNRKNRQSFPKSVHDFDSYLKGQDKVLIEIIERLQSDLRNLQRANEANTNNTLFREGKL